MTSTTGLVARAKELAAVATDLDAVHRSLSLAQIVAVLDMVEAAGWSIADVGPAPDVVVEAALDRLAHRAERLQGKLAMAAEVVGLGNESVDRDRERERDGYLMIPTLKALVADRRRLRAKVQDALDLRGPQSGRPLIDNLQAREMLEAALARSRDVLPKDDEGGGS